MVHSYGKNMVPFFTVITKRSTNAGGFTLTEILIAMTIMAILVTMSTPIYSKAIEQGRLDGAARELKTIWSAQRVYWLDNHSYAENIAALQNLDLLRSDLPLSQGSVSAMYIYEIASADGESFTASAVRNASSKWSGEIEINEFGVITGSVTATDGTELLPLSWD
jgi:prepilin-type N-terminal cleavage/methylation domain-containing protein